MYYVLHHNSENKINKQVTIDVTNYWKQKVESCMAHRTEVSRQSISAERLSYLKEVSSLNGTKQYEYFGIEEPSGYANDKFYSKISSINDDTFSLLWSLALGIESSKKLELNIVPVHFSNQGATLEGKGRAQLVSKLHAFYPKMMTKELIGGPEMVFDFRTKFYNQNCLFSGGALANPWTFRFLFGYPAFTYRENQFIRPRILAAHRPVYEEEFNEDRLIPKIEKTWGVVIIMWGWCLTNRKAPATIYTAGVSREATYGGYLLLLTPTKRYL